MEYLAGLCAELHAARKVMKRNGLAFATIWKIGESYSFNFDKKPLGYSMSDCGVNRTVIAIIN